MSVSSNRHEGHTAAHEESMSKILADVLMKLATARTMKHLKQAKGVLSKKFDLTMNTGRPQHVARPSLLAGLIMSFDNNRNVFPE